MTTPILTAGPIARSRNGVIGKDGTLPWRLKSDMAIFRAVTMGKPVIMGRKTWDSLPRKPLIGRTMKLSEAAAAHRLQEENTLGKQGTLIGKIVLLP